MPDAGVALLQKPLTDDQFQNLALLGWITELLQACFLVSDDLTDGSITRRGRPCWYRQEGVGLIAVNDAFMLESAIYLILKKRFRWHPAYIEIVELLHETTWQTEMGQLCDLITAPKEVELDNFSLEKHTFIVTYKTAYYSFYLPIALALHYLQLAAPENLKQAQDILIPLGQYYQVQDDYLDNFGDPSILGKYGTDIQENKCSWLICQAIQRCTPEQRQVLDTAYGRRDRAQELKVKAIFNQLGLKQVYEDYEAKAVSELAARIAAVNESKGLKKEVFESVLAKIYKRTK